MDHAGASHVRLLLPSGRQGAVRAADDSDSGISAPCGLADRLLRSRRGYVLGAVAIAVSFFRTFKRDRSFE